MKKWNSAMQAMSYQCEQLGPAVCMPVYYEQLVLRPKVWLEKILSFLGKYCETFLFSLSFLSFLSKRCCLIVEAAFFVPVCCVNRDACFCAEVPWNDSVLHHEQFIDKPGGISLSK